MLTFPSFIVNEAEHGGGGDGRKGGGRAKRREEARERHGEDRARKFNSVNKGNVTMVMVEIQKWRWERKKRQWRSSKGKGDGLCDGECCVLTRVHEVKRDGGACLCVLPASFIS